MIFPFFFTAKIQLDKQCALYICCAMVFFFLKIKMVQFLPVLFFVVLK